VGAVFADDSRLESRSYGRRESFNVKASRHAGMLGSDLQAQERLGGE